MAKNTKEFISTVFSLLLATSVLYVYGTLAANTNKITRLEAGHGEIRDVKNDITELRKGQREILKILISN